MTDTAARLPRSSDAAARVPRLSLIREVVQAAAPGAIDLALGEPAHAPPAAAVEALRGATAEDLRYAPNAGLPELRRAIAAREPLGGGEAESVLVTAGSQEALAVVCLGLLGPGDEVVVPEIAYPSYAALAGLAGATVRRVPWARLEDAFSPRTRLVLAGSPHNPTAGVLDETRLAALAERAALCGAWVALDRVYAPLLESPAPLLAGRRLLVLGGVSKAYALTGLRVGWLVATPALVGELLPVHQHLVTSAPRLAQRAALAALIHGETALAGARALYRERRRKALARLAAVPGLATRDPGVGFFLWLDVRRVVGRDTHAFALAAAARGLVVVVPGEAFGPAGAGFLRLSVATDSESLAEGLDRLCASLRP